MELEAGAARLQLLPQRAAYLPEHRTLLVADAHLGKAMAFRRLGVPVPGGTTAETLERLTAALAASGAARVVFLGDLLHSAHAQEAATRAAVAHWRERHAAVELMLVRGNHDRHAGDPPPDLGFDIVDEPWPIADAPGLAASHHPREAPGVAVLAGHWHPVVTLVGPGRDHVRLPCFCRVGALLVLPAFGAFTGGSPVPPPAGSTCWAVGGGRTWPALGMPG
jgi:DNA ligase-associated metallophosphoesterase